jgi:hypothetical protein
MPEASETAQSLDARQEAVQSLDARQLSLTRPVQAIQDLDADRVPDPEFMQLLGGYGALPVDLAALLLRCSEDEVVQMIVLGVGLGWMRTREFPLEKAWVMLRDGGWKQVGKDSRAPLTAGGLSHRREVIEAHLLLREENPGWSWTYEANFRKRNNAGLTIPDAVLHGEGARWAIEVERSTKLSEKLRSKLETLCATYDRVVYFGSGHVRKNLARLQASGDFSKLAMRPLPGEGPQWQQRQRRTDYEPSDRARRALQVINEDGIVFEEHLPRLLGYAPEEITSILSELDGQGCVRRHESKDTQGWIRCSHRGAARSGTKFKPIEMPSRGALVKRIVLTEIRLDVLERWPEAKWVTRRILEKGHDSKPADIPRAVVERGGRRYAVMVLESWQDPKKLLPRLQRWKEVYGGVLFYRANKMTQWVDGLVEKHGLEWMKIRNLPKPPPSAPYRTLEDEWQTGREPYRPVGYEVSLLWLINTEGMISEMQLPRVLGCSPEVTERLIAPLLEHGCLERKDGWIYCRGYGPKLSGTDMAAPAIPNERYREQRFQLMEVRLSHGEPVSSQNWKTNRQLAQEKSAAGEPSPTNRWPNAAVQIDGKWCAIALVFGEFRRGKLLKQLTRWAQEHGELKCYCPAEDVAPFRRLLEGRNLSSATVEAFPKAPDGSARERQEAFEARLIEEREERKSRDSHKFRAQKAVADAVRTGRLKKPEHCEVCGEKIPKGKLQGHHEDYSKPLEVRWVCTKCHPAEDKARRECEARERQRAEHSPREKRQLTHRS